MPTGRSQVNEVKEPHNAGECFNRPGLGVDETTKPDGPILWVRWHVGHRTGREASTEQGSFRLRRDHHSSAAATVAPIT